MFLGLKSEYIQLIEKLPITSTQMFDFVACILVSLAVGTILKNVIGEEIQNNFQLCYWLVLSRREFYFYIIFKTIHWFYFYLGLFLFVVSGTRIKKYILVLPAILLYMLVAYLICIQKTNSIHISRGSIYFQRKKKFIGKIIFGKKCKPFRDRKETVQGNRRDTKYSLFEKCPVVELFMFSWKYRYAAFENIFCKLAVVTGCVFLTYSHLDETISFVVCFILFLLLSFTDDNYWKREILNAILWKNMGVGFGKYFAVNVLSGVFYQSLILSLFYGLMTGSILKGVFFLLITTCFVLFWNSVYLYLYFSPIGKSEMVKMLYLAVMLLISFVPAANVAVGIYFYVRAFLMWKE